MVDQQPPLRQRQSELALQLLGCFTSMILAEKIPDLWQIHSELQIADGALWLNLD
jgi:hypothetical protein